MQTVIYLSKNLIQDTIAVVKKFMKTKDKNLIIFNNQELLEECSKKMWHNRSFLPHTNVIDQYIDKQHCFLSLNSNHNPNNAKNIVYVDHICESEIIFNMQILILLQDNPNLIGYMQNLQKYNKNTTIYKYTNDKWIKLDSILV